MSELLEQRSAAQAEQDYEAADGLHAEITEMGITLDTARKTWRVAREKGGDRRSRGGGRGGYGGGGGGRRGGGYGGGA